MSTREIDAAYLEMMERIGKIFPSEPGTVCGGGVRNKSNSFLSPSNAPASVVMTDFVVSEGLKYTKFTWSDISIHLSELFDSNRAQPMRARDMEP